MLKVIAYIVLFYPLAYLLRLVHQMYTSMTPYPTPTQDKETSAADTKTKET